LYNILFTGDFVDGDESEAVSVQPLKMEKQRHSVYYDFNGEDHDIIEQSENEDGPDDELDDIGMNALPIYFKYLF
jgi:hypothetical protein